MKLELTIITAVTVTLLATLGTGNVQALESDNSYLLDDSEFVSIIVSTDTDGSITFDEVFITPEGGDTEFFMDAGTVIHERLSSDHSTGLVFGKTTTDESLLLKWTIDENENVKIAAKVWTEPENIRIVTNGEVLSLF
jgi:hypothetical protein